MHVKTTPKDKSTKWDPNVMQPQAQIWSKLDNQLYGHVSNFLILSQILACAPAGSHREHLEKKTSKRRLLQGLHLSWCLLLYVVLAVFVYTEYTELIVNLPTVQKLLYSCEYVVFLVHVLQITVKCYHARRKFRRFLHDFLQFDCRLLQFGAAPEYWRFSRFCHAHYLPLVVQFLCTLVIGFYVHQCQGSTEFWNFLRSVIGYMLPNGIVYASLLQYFGLLYGIARRRSRLNKVLQAELSRGGVELHGSLERLRELCARLEYFTKQANDAFGPSVLLVYLGSFLNISVGLFLSYRYMDGARDATLTSTLYSMLWALMNIGKIFLVLYYNHRVQAQKNNTELILNNVESQNMELQETIKRFILQLHINTRSSVVCGVVVLNLDFIKSLLLAVSTLFIFLLQYQDVTTEERE